MKFVQHVELVSFKQLSTFELYRGGHFLMKVYPEKTTDISQEGANVVVIVWYLDLQLSIQSVSITSDVVSSNPAHGEVYSIQHYVIKFVSDLRQVHDFLCVL